MKRMSESGETRALRPWERGEDAATGSPAEASPSGDGASRDAGGGPGRMRRDAMNDGRSAARSGRKLEGPGTSGRDEGKGQGAAGEREGTRGGAGAGASGKKRRFNALEAEAKRVAAEQADRAADNAKAKEARPVVPDGCCLEQQPAVPCCHLSTDIAVCISTGSGTGAQGEGAPQVEETVPQGHQDRAALAEEPDGGAAGQDTGRDGVRELGRLQSPVLQASFHSTRLVAYPWPAFSLSCH